MGKRTPRVADKVLEHELAPSGFVRLYRYKEPFMPVEKGFGYQGVLLMDGSGKTVQCHICGEWMAYIGFRHLKSHQTNANQYKDRFGLDQTTALVSEEHRKKLLNHVPPKAKPWSDRTEKEKEAIRAKARATWDRLSREKQNQRGTCPAQLVDRLRKKKEELGREPMRKEIVSWVPTLESVFGSLAEAYRQAGMEPRDIHSPRFTKRSDPTILIASGKQFYRVHGRLPQNSDHERGLLDTKYKDHCTRYGNYEEFRRVLARELNVEYRPLSYAYGSVSGKKQLKQYAKT